jgi:hypothetical protein
MKRKKTKTKYEKSKNKKSRLNDKIEKKKLTKEPRTKIINQKNEN